MAESSPPSDDVQALALLEQAMAQPSAERAAWIARRSAAPRTVRDRALALLERGAEVRAWLPTGGAPDQAGEPPIPARIGAYRITGRIGQGGMGAVYRGERATGDFEHAVAIKVIRPGPLSDALVARFRRERQTLARLAHPNIARLFDGGETETGDPYIVMEFVDGRPLAQWLESGPAVPARLELFLAVAAAVAFAHQNLVVHGDVTPSNILVDAEDRPRLIDFGIARPVDEAMAAASGGRPRSSARSLTPGFAAPERLEGQGATTLADIYSLGRVLERLVGGSVRDRELAAIVARATAAEPQARYSTVEALRADVLAHIRGQPVAAVGAGRGYVFRKFVGRHRLAVSGAATAATLVLVSLGITLAANARAEAARTEAETRFQQTRAIAKTLLFEVYDEVGKVEGTTAARALLAETGVKYLDALADGDAPLDVQLEVGRGYVRLAQVLGGGQHSQLGRYADSGALLARGEIALRKAQAAHPDDKDARMSLAHLLIEQSGSNLYTNNKPDLARKQAIEAQQLLAPVAATDTDAARMYITAIQAEGDGFGFDGDYARARAAHQRAEAFVATLPPAMVASEDVRMARGGNLRLLAEANHYLGDDRAALPPIQLAVAVNEGLLADQPRSPARIRKVAAARWYHAVILRELGRRTEAMTSIRTALDLARRLRDRDPADAGGAAMFAVVGEVAVQLLGESGRSAESFQLAAEVVRAHRLITGAPDASPGTKRSMASSLVTIGGAYYNGGDYARACGAWREAQVMFANLAENYALTVHDAKQNVTQLERYLRANCDGGAPRAGMPRPLTTPTGA